jgi:hypothetical protein
MPAEKYSNGVRYYFNRGIKRGDIIAINLAEHFHVSVNDAIKRGIELGVLSMGNTTQQVRRENLFKTRQLAVCLTKKRLRERQRKMA